MPRLAPLRFEPLYKQYLWGGRQLETLLGKPLGSGTTYAESWEAVDHGDDQSEVANGPLAGLTLHQVVEQHGAELLGRHHPQPQFPLLFKFLDAKRTLSVQVHPNDAQAAKLSPPDLGKTEAWVVLAAEPGSKLYAGLKSGVDLQQLGQAIEAGNCDQCLHAFEPAVGDCLLIEAGTVHAIGAGLVVAEIQQASNTTFRLFDWNRTDSNGQSRPLHIDQSLATIDFARGAVSPQKSVPTGRAGVDRLVACDKFVLDRCQAPEGTPLSPGQLDLDNRFHLLSVLSGTLQLETADETWLMAHGQTLLLPAACGKINLIPRGKCQWLDMYLPD